MNLVLDIGNTSVRLAIFSKNKIIKNELIHTFSSDFLRKFISANPDIKNICVSNTAMKNDFIVPISKEFKIRYFDINKMSNLPICSEYQTPETLGSDRLALAVGASIKYPGENLIIDLGTCITYDIIIANNYIGGQISPGLKMRLLALHNYTANLPNIDFQIPEGFLGKNTDDSILIGVYEGVFAEINGILQKYKMRYPNINIILTGGDSQIFQEKLKNINFIDPYLLMHGLNYIIASNE